MGIKVLFIYPNTFGMNMLPPAIALFSAMLKKDNHEVKIFDTTYYSIDYGIDSDGSKVERLNALPYDMKGKGIERKKNRRYQRYRPIQKISNSLFRQIKPRGRTHPISKHNYF